MASIALINSSLQQKNYTAYTLKIIKEELVREGFNLIEINLKDFVLPFPGELLDNDNVKELHELLTKADAYIIAGPEYNGSFTAKLKLMVENAGFPSLLKGKPLGLIGIASGVLGATKSLEQQRIMFSHIGSFVLPRVVSIPQVEKKFDDEGNCCDEKTRADIVMASKNMTDFYSLINKH